MDFFFWVGVRGHHRKKGPITKVYYKGTKKITNPTDPQDQLFRHLSGPVRLLGVNCYK